MVGLGLGWLGTLLQITQAGNGGSILAWTGTHLLRLFLCHWFPRLFLEQLVTNLTPNHLC